MSAVETLRGWIDSYAYRPYDEPETVEAAREVLTKIDAALALCERDHYLHYANGVDELAQAVRDVLS
jgi:hypothetical protein